MIFMSKTIIVPMFSGGSSVYGNDNPMLSNHREMGNELPSSHGYPPSPMHSMMTRGKQLNIRI